MVFNFSAVINDYKRMLVSDLTISDVTFIWRQANEVLIALLGWFRVMLVSRFILGLCLVSILLL